jgi:RHS repeat-associated protein
VNSAQQATQISSTYNDTYHAPTLFQNITYTPSGALASLQDACTGSCTARQETYTYNNRLQPILIELGTSASHAADSCLVYYYYSGPSSSCSTPGQTGSNNGNVLGYFYQDTLGTTSYQHKDAYTYDALNRLTNSTATAVSPGTASYNFTYNYNDRYGNPTCGSSPGTGCPSLTYSATTNHVTTSGWTYDAAGNATANGTGTGAHTFTYDGEGRLTKVDGGSTQNFTYDAAGRQVQFTLVGASLPWDNVLDPAGRLVARYDENAAKFDIPAQFYLGGRELGYYGGCCTTYTKFVHPNALGSTTMITDQTTAVVNDTIWYPFGDFWQETQVNGQIFASTEQRSGTSSLDFTPSRPYDYGYYRWLTPDPMGGDLANPQSLNRYAYVMNNPTTLIDPTGLDTINCTIKNGCREPGGNGCTILNGCRDPGMNVNASMDCTIDGLASFCGQNIALVEAGAAAPCPNGDCNGIRASQGFGGSTIYQQWVPSTLSESPGGPDGVSATLQLNTAHWQTVGTLSSDFAAPNLGAVNTSVANAGQTIEGLVTTIHTVTEPLHNTAISYTFLLAGATLIQTGVGAMAVGCVGSGGLACGASIFGGVHVVAGGGALLYFGYQYTRQVTVPSFVGLFSPVAPGP